MSLATNTRIRLEMPACRCGYPSITTIGAFDGSNFTLRCPNCSAKRALLSESTANTIAKVSKLFGTPQVITLRRRQTISHSSAENSPDIPANRK